MCGSQRSRSDDIKKFLVREEERESKMRSSRGRRALQALRAHHRRVVIAVRIVRSIASIRTSRICALFAGLVWLGQTGRAGFAALLGVDDAIGRGRLGRWLGVTRRRVADAGTVDFLASSGRGLLFLGCLRGLERGNRDWGRHGAVCGLACRLGSVFLLGRAGIGGFAFDDLAGGREAGPAVVGALLGREVEVFGESFVVVGHDFGEEEVADESGLVFDGGVADAWVCGGWREEDCGLGGGAARLVDEQENSVRHTLGRPVSRPC